MLAALHRAGPWPESKNIIRSPSTATSLNEQSFRLHRVQCPIGTLLIVTDTAGVLRALDFSDFESRMHRLLQRHYGSYSLAETNGTSPWCGSLQRYFDGDLRALATIDCATNGTVFQRNTWEALRKIEAGQTRTYGQLAAELGLSNAARAVGLANGSNPIAIVVPCHRLVGANGNLTGYAGGLERKRWLLEHEQRHLA
jgi:O-6-methylguanine DNA methyltransferase